MNNSEHYHHHQSGPPPSGPRMDFGMQRPPPPVGHPPPLQHNYNPQGFFQNQGQFLGPPTPSNSFHGKDYAGSTLNQTPTPSNAFHSHRFPPPVLQPNLTRPPPSMPLGNRPFSSSEIHSNSFSTSEAQRRPFPANEMPLGNAAGIYHHESAGSFSISAPSLPPNRISQIPPTEHLGPISHSFTDTAVFGVHSVPFHTQAGSHAFQSTSGGGIICEDQSNLNMEDEDSIWLKQFEQAIISRPIHHQQNLNTKKKNLKLSEVQQMVSRSRTLKENLCQLREKMNMIREDADDKEWKELLEQAEDAKTELDNITRKFQNKLFVEDVKHLISQRKKKRERSRKQHKAKIKEIQELKVKWKNTEEEIDAWREKLRLEEEEKRREIAIKAEADSILGEVRQKQIDAVKMQQLLENLISLRIVRLNKGAAHGHISTPQKDQLFSTTIDKIADVVKSQMKEYELEEQTLCVMMEESTSYKRSSIGKESKDAVNKLEMFMKKLLFSDTVPSHQETYEDITAADQSLEILLQRRHEWDQFISNKSSPLASSVPVNWVVPPNQPSSSWAKFQG